MGQMDNALTQPEAMISLRNLRVSYGDREILHGINFDVMHGETLVILGGSGSGKSTLLRTLVGSGKAEFRRNLAQRENIAAISTGEMGRNPEKDRHVVSGRRTVRLDDGWRKRRLAFA